MEWIKCEDRFPEHMQKVLAFYDGYMDVMEYWTDDEYWFNYDIIFTKEVITHWMPLPVPPKED